MTKEDIIEQINKSYNEHTGTNEAIDDASFYIHQQHIEDIENIINPFDIDIQKLRYASSDAEFRRLLYEMLKDKI